MTPACIHPRDTDLLEQALRSSLRPQSLLVAVAHPAFAIVVGLLLFQDVASQPLTTWLMCIGAATALRAGWLRRAARTNPPRFALMIENRITTGLLGLAWGTGAGVLATSMPPESFGVIFAIIFAILAGSVVTLTADPRAFCCMLVTLGLPLIAGLIGSQTNTVPAIVAAMTFGMGSLLFRRTHRSFLEHLRALAALGESREALAREQAHLTGVLESAPVGIAVLDDAKRVRSVNAQFESIFGWTRDELPGRSLDQLLIPEDQEAQHSSLLARVRGGEIIHAEVKRRDKAGRLLDVRVSAVALRDTPDGGFIVTYEDISDRKTMERALVASEARMRRVIDSNIIGISLWNVDGRILTANDEMLRLTGYTREDLAAGRARWSSLVPPEEAERDAAVVNGLAEGIKQEPWRCDLLRRDGTRLPVVLGLGALDERLQTEGVAFVLDMTETHRIERELQEARDQAERAARSQAAFLANMSHEIRTPMNAVLGMIQIVLASELTASQRSSLSLARGAADSLLGILNDILDLSKIEADQLPIEIIPFDLGEVVRSTTSLFAIQAGQKQLTLTAEVDSAVPATVRGDPMRLRQVLANLIGNAVKFTNAGSVTLAVRPDRKDPRLVCFAVRDTGIGIAPESQDRIFEQFQQADGSTSRRFGGTGLGLAIAQRLVALMGGRIEVHSSPGAGSEFRFSLPLPADLLPAVRQELRLPARPARALRLLLAEDVEVNQLVARTMLEMRGHQVDVVANGREAIDALARCRYDLVLMDIQMPVMDGIAATAAIRAMEGARRVPIVALTAHAMSDERARCLGRGMDDYLAKPFTAEDLCEVVERGAGGLEPAAAQAGGGNTWEGSATTGGGSPMALRT